MELIFREIEERDYPSALMIWNNELGNNNLTADNFASHQDKFKDNENYKAFVAVLNEKIVGFVYTMQYTPWGACGDQIWIQGIAVQSDMQGKGIGSKLLNFIEKYSKDKGISYITLNTGFLRTAAHTFYERNGYSSGNYNFGKQF